MLPLKSEPPEFSKVIPDPLLLDTLLSVMVELAAFDKVTAVDEPLDILLSRIVELAVLINRIPW